MSNLTETDYKRMSIDQSFKPYQRDDLKVIYKIELDNENNNNNNNNNHRCIISKILKLDENNQYSFAMIKPMPTGCIKEHPSLAWLKFNLLLKTVDLDYEISHLFVVDIEFNEKKKKL